MSSSPNTDAQKSAPYSVTLVFYTQDFNKIYSNVAVLTLDGGARNFRQTGVAVWVFHQK